MTDDDFAALREGPRGDPVVAGVDRQRTLPIDIKGSYSIARTDDQFEVSGEIETLARIVSGVLKRLGITSVTDKS